MSHLVPGGGEEGGEPGEEAVPGGEVHRAVAGGHAGRQAVQDQQRARPAVSSVIFGMFDQNKMFR